MLENKSAIAPRVLWSRQVCVCTGALSRSSVLSQVISSCPVWVARRNSGSRRLRAEAPVPSPQSFSFLSVLHRVVVHYERPRTPSGGFAVLSLPGCGSGCPSFPHGVLKRSLLAPPGKTLGRALRHPLAHNCPEREIFLLQ